jgi:hypothetical protein
VAFRALDIKVGAGIERLMGTAASRGCSREAHMKQWVVFMELVELRNSIKVSIIWIQDDRVVCRTFGELVLEYLLSF